MSLNFPLIYSGKLLCLFGLRFAPLIRIIASSGWSQIYYCRYVWDSSYDQTLNNKLTWSENSLTLKMGEICFSESSASMQTAPSWKTEDGNPYSLRRQKLKSNLLAHKTLYSWMWHHLAWYLFTDVSEKCATSLNTDMTSRITNLLMTNRYGLRCAVL
jgi:hypothetical protein